MTTDPISHAQRYRRITVTKLITQLRLWEGRDVFAHPVTGNLIVVNADGVWLHIIEVGDLT